MALHDDAPPRLIGKGHRPFGQTRTVPLWSTPSHLYGVQMTGFAIALVRIGAMAEHYYRAVDH